MERSKPETSKLERSKPEINKQKGEKQAWEQEKQFLDGQKSIEQRDGKQKVGEQQQKQEHQAQGSEEACYQLGESEQIGGTFEEQPVVVVENLEKQSGAMEKTRGIECDRIVGSSSKGRNWAEVVKKTPHETDDRPSLIQIAKNESQFIEAEKLLYEKAIEDGSNMGCKLTDPNKESWAKEIENKMNTGWGPNTKLSDKSTGTHSEEERDNYFFFQI
ncbi:hypothetical protein V6N11_025011 [Hibiscus sabdariffa]|uniref:Uncharacterized protein n=1 Tax=Hibiscus sabdariffa TaxID=183260 RepID=A0ABR2QNU3_9ROSI